MPALAKQLRLGTLHFRYVNTHDDYVILWTTSRLYQGGDFSAFLVDANDDLEERFDSPVKDDCIAMASIWTHAHSDEPTYRIEEEP